MEEPPLAVQPPATPQPQSKSLATTSMVLGIISLTCLGLLVAGMAGMKYWSSPPLLVFISFVISLPVLGLITGLWAIISGHIAYSRARKAPERYGGAGFAFAGLLMGYASFLLTMLLLVAILVPMSREPWII
jgi:hypothetical protein